MPTISDRFKMRRGTAADLAAVNEVPLLGEWIWEEDQGLDDGKYRLKIGDGVTRYNDLEYLASGGGIESIVSGAGIDVDNTDPKNPVVSSTLGSIALSGTVDDYDDLPTGLGPGDDGAAYFNFDDGLVYIWDGTAFPDDGDGISAGGGGIIQTKSVVSTTSLSTTAVIPPRTTPTISQGDQISGLTLSITPRRASSLLRLRLSLPMTTSSASTIGMRFAVFRDSGTNAIYAVSQNMASSGSFIGAPTMEFVVPSVQTVSTTFTVRWGVSSGTGYLLRDSTGDWFPGVSCMSFQVEEITA